MNLVKTMEVDSILSYQCHFYFSSWDYTFIRACHIFSAPELPGSKQVMLDSANIRSESLVEHSLGKRKMRVRDYLKSKFSLVVKDDDCHVKLSGLKRLAVMRNVKYEFQNLHRFFLGNSRSEDSTDN